MPEVQQLLPGKVVLLGSGETSPSGRKAFKLVFQSLPTPPHLALLETPAGFELNSDLVIGRVADFIRQRLINYQPQLSVVPARRREPPFSTDDPQLLQPLLDCDAIFLGPGSPTYAVRQLRGSLAWHYLLARHRLGAPLILASAAVIAISRYALPVYEIFKVGEDLHWKDGLDLFGLYDLPLVFVPHWDNNNGGAELDTSRCFMGQSRFAQLMRLLPPDLTVIGIDEETALVLDLQGGQGQVLGVGAVTLIHTGHEHEQPELDLASNGLQEVAESRHAHVHQYLSGESFPLQECCPFRLPPLGVGAPEAVWQRVLAAQAERERRRQGAPAAAEMTAPAEVLRLVQERQAARQRKDWAAADRLRSELAALGWKVLDTPQGPKLEALQ